MNLHPTFTAYLRAQARASRTDHIGDLARDWISDASGRPRGPYTFAAVTAHLSRNGACEAAHIAASEAWVEWLMEYPPRPHTSLSFLLNQYGSSTANTTVFLDIGETDFAHRRARKHPRSLKSALVKLVAASVLSRERPA